MPDRTRLTLKTQEVVDDFRNAIMLYANYETATSCHAIPLDGPTRDELRTRLRETQDALVARLLHMETFLPRKKAASPFTPRSDEDN